MYKFCKDGVSVLTVIDKRRMKNNGLYPVKIEVIYKRRQRYYSSGQDVTIDEWETMWTSRRMHEKLVDIERNFNRIRNSVEDLVVRGCFCFANLDARIGKSYMSVNEAIVLKMNSLRNAGRINSYYRYRSMLHAIESYKGRRIMFDDIDVHWLKRCEEVWADSGKNCTSINIYMKSLRCIYHDAIERGLVNEAQCPFRHGGYKIPASRKRTLALTKEQIRQIIDWDGDRETCYWRDLWVFSYLCNGINFRDMLYLRYGNIIDGEIVFARSKTSSCPNARTVRAIITPLMRDIMERSGNGQDGPSERLIFKHAKGNEDAFKLARVVRIAIISCNKALRRIADDLAIPHFTTYSARHSFATVLRRQGIDIQYISESLGHASLKMTENYLAGFNKEERIRNSRLLIDFL